MQKCIFHARARMLVDLMDRAELTLSRLIDHYERGPRPHPRDPFKSLISIILSQNTNSRNMSTAYQRLEANIGVTPENIATSSIESLTESIRPAGMHNQRSRVLKKVAETVLKCHQGDVAPILDLPYEEAREILMLLPGVGYKTADVLLLFNANKKIVPVDRHIFRITKRLELVPQNAGYDTVRETLEAATPSGRHEDVHVNRFKTRNILYNDFYHVHVSLIQLGREICKAIRPRCPECFLDDLCPYPSKTENTNV
jgi:endonuclease-3